MEESSPVLTIKPETRTTIGDIASPSAIAAASATHQIAASSATSVDSVTTMNTPVDDGTAATTPVSSEEGRIKPEPTHPMYPKQENHSPTATATAPGSPSSEPGHHRAGSASSADPVHPNAKTTSTKASNGSVTTRQNMSTPICKNCKTQTTPLWRRDESGQVLCNACGLFLKLHGRPRPISLKSDVIKSRNRVKHNNKSSPNTPELKAKDSKARFTSKQYKPKSRSGSNSKRNSQSEKSKQQVPMASNNSNLGTTSVSTIAGLSSQASLKSPGLPPILPRNSVGQFYTTQWAKTQNNAPIHPLHYPNSTPVQFANNLNRVTSPLLLSTTAPPKFTASQSSERSSSQQNLGRDAVLNAAGALETLSQQSSTDRIPGMRLDNKIEPQTQQEPPLPPIAGYVQKAYSPATELNGFATPPLLPQSGKPSVVNSPYQQITPGDKLPPLKNLTQSSPMGLNPTTPGFGPQRVSPMLGPTGGLPSISQSPMLAPLGSRPGQPQSVRLDASNEELRTRISELELVNDLYKTRIVELEAMDNTAKQRELLLKKRIDDLTDSLRRRQELYEGEEPEAKRAKV